MDLHIVFLPYENLLILQPESATEKAFVTKCFRKLVVGLSLLRIGAIILRILQRSVKMVKKRLTNISSVELERR